MTERDFQRAVIDLARRLGWRVAHFHDSRRQVRPGVLVGDGDAAGFPDLCLARRGRLIFAELKAENGRLRPEQREWIDQLKAIPSPVSAYVWRPADWPMIELALR